VAAERCSSHDFKISTELAAVYFDYFEVAAAAEGPLAIMRRQDAMSRTLTIATEGGAGRWPAYAIRPEQADMRGWPPNQ
jgi:hypothetical protein